MDRRSVLSLFSAVGSALALFARSDQSRAAAAPEEDWTALAAKARADQLARFPFQYSEVHGRDALATWVRLREKGDAWPVVIGSEEDFDRILDQYFTNEEADTSAILKKAAALRHPADLEQKAAADSAIAREHLRDMIDSDLPLVGQIVVQPDGSVRESSEEEIRASLRRELGHPGPGIGEWPDQAPESPELILAKNLVTGRFHEKTVILILPTRDGSEVPALLRYGNWNACPPPEYHVAALASWRERYGAELVGMSGDAINLRVSRRPQSREEALALAREHYLYCNDTVDQGTRTLSALAAMLMESDWWFFWWD